MEIKIKDPVSALTHFIAMMLALIAAAPLLIKASSDGSLHLAALTVFIISMVFLYAASTIYHTLDISPKINRLLKKIDHMMIFILIAGTYTPICLIVLGDIAISGIIIKGCFIMCPKWFSSSLYIAMGWVCILAFSKITETLSSAGFLWLLAGGIIYTIGGIIYALKLPLFNAKHKSFGSHEIFHLFVMGGSLCHYILMYHFVA